MTTLIPPPTRQIIGYVNKDGTVIGDRTWLIYWLQGLFERTGGTTAPTNNEIMVDLPDDVGIEEIRHEVSKAIESAALWNQVAELSAVVAELKKEIDGLKSGTML